MTVHAIRVNSSASQESNPETVPSPGPPDWSADLLQQRIEQNALGALTEVLAGQTRPAMLVNTEVGGSGVDYIRAIYRLDPATRRPSCWTSSRTVWSWTRSGTAWTTTTANTTPASPSPPAPRGARESGRTGPFRTVSDGGR